LSDAALAGSPPSRLRLSTLDKMADLLRVFVPARPAWRLGELAEALGWDKATTLRFVGKLVELGFLERDDDTYRLGRLTGELGAQYLGASDGRQRLVRAIERVHARTGLTTQVGVLDGAELVIILSEEGTTLVKVAASLGARLPLHATAIGKAILAQLDEPTFSALVPEQAGALTARTVTERTALQAEVARVRSTGLAHAGAELADGLDAHAVPIPWSIFGAAAALGCAGPTAAVEAVRAEVEAALRAAADELHPLQRMRATEVDVQTGGGSNAAR
jgi:DNA-binding IclR family transcriptional regulator